MTDNPNSARITVQMTPEFKDIFEQIARGNNRSASGEAYERLKKSVEDEQVAEQRLKAFNKEARKRR